MGLELGAYPLMRALDHKECVLRVQLASLSRLLVAYSGGADSAFLAWAAYQVLGQNMMAILADSPSLPRRELKLAVDFAAHWSIPVLGISSFKMTSRICRHS